MRKITHANIKKRSPYSITEHRVLELIPVLGSQLAGDLSHAPGGRLPLLFARPAVTPATLKRAATNFAAWRTEVHCSRIRILLFRFKKNVDFYVFYNDVSQSRKKLLAKV